MSNIARHFCRPLVRIAVAALMLIAWRPISAQLTLRSLVVPLSNASRVGDFAVRNDSEVVQEVSIDFRFGYLRSDTTGNSRMVYDDTVAARERSMAAWTNAYPRRFLLAPGAEQVVRVSARPPAELAPGVYWTRLVTGSQPQSPAADVGSGAITPTLIVRVEQVTTVLYRHGEVTGGIAVGTPSVDATDSLECQLRIPITRTGVAPFIGQSRMLVRGADGKVVHESRAPVSVYFDFTHRLTVPRNKLQKGEYTAEIRFDNDQSDVPPALLPRVSPVVVRAPITIR